MAALSFLSCTPETETGPPTPVPLPLQVEYSDSCRTYWSDESSQPLFCLADPETEIELWVSTAPRIEAEIDVQLGELRLTTADADPIQDGFRFTLEIPAGADRLEVRARSGADESSWSLEIRPRPEHFRQLRELRDRGAHAELEKRLEVAPPEERGEILSLLARIELRKGSSERALEYLEEAVIQHTADHALGQRVSDALVMVHLYNNIQDYKAAREILDAIPSLPASAGGEKAMFDYYSGLIASSSGDFRTALKRLDDASQRTERLKMLTTGNGARQILGTTLRAAGQHDEAIAVFEALKEESPELLEYPCFRANLGINSGWQEILAIEAGQATDAPVRTLQEALDLALEHRCRLVLDNARINLALAYFHDGQSAQASETLRQAQAENPRPPLLIRMWNDDLEARLARLDGRLDEALEHYEEVEDIARALVDVDGMWRATLGRAQILAERGDVDLARTAFEEAEQLLERSILQVPINAGRDLFGAARARGSRLHLEHLLKLGQVGEAFALARRSRLRGLRGLLQARLTEIDPEAQARWDAMRRELIELRQSIDELSADAWLVPGDRAPLHQAALLEAREELSRLVDEMTHFLEQNNPSATLPGNLPAFADDEIQLLFHPVPEGLAGFVHQAGTIRHQRLPTLDPTASPEALAAQLLEPFRAELTAPGRPLRILASSTLQAIDFHALPWNGAPLIHSRPVVYGLDAATAETEIRETAQILMIADPRGDLPQARQEIALIDGILGIWPGEPSLVRLVGDEASPAALRRELERADHLHYAGHGEFTPGDAWKSALPLAEDGRLTVNDILSLERVPFRVVLSGCQTGQGSTAGEGASLAGLAQAFLARGSESVIAAVRPVEDVIAAQLMRSYYEYLSDMNEAEALRRAQIDLYRQNPAADWSSFRLFTR